MVMTTSITVLLPPPSQYAETAVMHSVIETMHMVDDDYNLTTIVGCHIVKVGIVYIVHHNPRQTRGYNKRSWE